MKIIFKYFLFFLTLISFSNLYSQSLNFLIKKYSVDNGLPDNRVNDIAQDSTGRIWIAMKTGIAVYDGVEWKKFTEKDGVPEIEYTKIKIDKKSVIWFLPLISNNPILSFKNLKWEKIKNIYSIPMRLNSLDIMYEDIIPTIYVGSAIKGIFKYKDNYWHEFTKKNGLQCDSVSNVLVSGNRVYVSSARGLSVIDDNKITNYNFAHYNIDPKVLTINEIIFDSTQKRKILLLGESWIGELENEKIKTIKKGFYLPSLGINDACVINYHPSGDILFGNGFVIYSYNIFTGEFRQLFTESPASNTGATSILVDYEGNIWFTSFRGIFKYEYTPFRNYFKKDGLLENEVSAISEFNSGELVFGHNWGLTIKSDKGFKQITNFSGNRNEKISRVLDFYHDKINDVIYFCSVNNGVGKLFKNGKIIWYKSPLAKRYYSIFPKDKNSLIISTNLGFYELRGNKLYLLPIKVPEMVRKGILDNNRTIYFVSARGIHSWNSNNVKNLKLKGIDANNFFSVFYNDKYGLLAGSEFGLFRVENDSIAKYKINGKEINESVYFIMKDYANNLWIGTNNGVLKFDGKNLKRYNKKDGLAGNETNRSAGFVDNKGNVWIGTDEGLSMYTQNDVNYSNSKPKLDLTSIEDEHNEKHNPFFNVKFAPDNNTLVFNYRGLSFIDETQNVYQVKLYKTDDDWSDEFITNYPYSRFNNLTAGNYIFSVRMKNAKGIWSDQKHTANIIITKYFYEKPLFIIGSSLIFLLVLYFIYDSKMQKKYNKKLKEVVESRTKQLRLKQAELITSLERYRGIVDSQTDLLVRVDGNNCFTFVNDAYCKVFGKTKDELIGKAFLPLVHPDDRDNTLEEMKKLFESPHRVKIEQRAYTVNGYRWFSWEDYAIFDNNGSLKEIQAVGRDITIQKQMEDELEKRVRERTIELKSLISQSPIGILTFNENGLLIDYNFAANSLFGDLNNYLNSENSFNIFEDKILIKNNYSEILHNLNTSKGLLVTRKIFIDDTTEKIYQNLLGRYLIYRFYTVEYEDKSKNIILLLEDVTEAQKTEEANKKLAEEKVRITTFIKTVETERERISKELHDGIGQLLTSAKLKLDILKMKSNTDKKEIDEALGILLNAGDEIRRIVKDLKPYDIDNFGLTAALEILFDNISKDSGLNIQYSMTNFNGFKNKKKENTTYRIIQEALNNILKHSKANNAKVIIVGADKFVNIEISDDGIGCKLEMLEDKNSGSGIKNMKERTDLLGGKISFTVLPQTGLKINLTIPI